MKKNKIIKEFIIIFWIFIIGSISGYVFEMLDVFFQKGFFETRKGLIYGPFIPVYGIGAVIYYMILKNMQNKGYLKIFLITMILGGITEYVCSYIQEKVFGTISWDYSYLIFNINGRTSLLHCTYWGIAGVLFTKYIIPFIENLKLKLNKNSLRILTGIFSIFIIFDICISWMAVERQSERNKNIEPENSIDIFLDNYYSEEFLSTIFTNMKRVY